LKLIPIKKCKKGALSDLFVYLVIGIILIITCVMFLYMATLIKDELHEKTDIPSEIINQSMGNVVWSYTSLKWISYFLLVGIALAIFVNNFLVQTHPIFFGVYVFIVIIAVIVAVPISNAYEELYHNEILGDTFHEFKGASWIFLRLPTWITIIGIIGAMILFSSLLKSRGGYGGL